MYIYININDVVCVGARGSVGADHRYVYIYTYTYMNMYMYIYIYTIIHIYVYTDICSYKYK